MSDVRIPVLIERLVAEGDLSAADGARLKAQGNHLRRRVADRRARLPAAPRPAADARIGTGTQRSLGASSDDRARQIALNLERRRWLKRELNPSGSRSTPPPPSWSTGRTAVRFTPTASSSAPENQTPSLEKPFASVVANPPWYVPAGIARNEILPQGPAYLASQNMYISNGR
jgi:murein L,D-transpeptidase YcbB/YkuD